MYKVAINKCYGGFSVSEEVGKILLSRYGLGTISKWGTYFLPEDIKRHDKRLIEVLEEFDEDNRGGGCSKVVIFELLTPVYRISNYDGYETIHQPEGYDWVTIED